MCVVCVVFLVGQHAGVWIRVCIEKPRGYFINLDTGSLFFLFPDKIHSPLSLEPAATLPSAFVL